MAENDPSSGKAHIVINREWCKGCGICIAFCPGNVLGMDPEDKATVLHPEGCTACSLCERLCPDMAIELSAAPNDPPGSSQEQGGCEDHER